MDDDLSQNQFWRNPADWPFRWTSLLVEKLRERGVGPIQAPDLWIASDYSGVHKNSRFFSIGVLIIDASSIASWQRDRVAIRQRFLGDGRRMSFKALNDNQRRAALIPFLQAADALRGYCIVFAIDRHLRHLLGFEGFREGLVQREIISANWKPQSFERMITVTHLAGVLLGLTTMKDQGIWWISDVDDSLASELHKHDFARMAGTFAGWYVPHNLGQLGVGTTETDEGDRLEEDLAAIPDLAAGAVGEFLNKMSSEFGKVPGIPNLGPHGLSDKADLITSWFFHRNVNHKKIACYLQEVKKGHVQVGTIWEDQSSPTPPTLIPLD
jgi:hypothetical protein